MNFGFGIYNFCIININIFYKQSSCFTSTCLAKNNYCFLFWFSELEDEIDKQNIEILIELLFDIFQSFFCYFHKFHWSIWLSKMSSNQPCDDKIFAARLRACNFS